MKWGTLFSASICLVGRVASAGSLEAAGWVGPAFPFYEQSFQYDPGIVTLPTPGATLRQEGTFRLHGRGGLAAGAGVTFYLVPAVGIEGRLDTADVQIQPEGAVYSVSADLPPPLPDLSTRVALGSGTVDVTRVTPLSLNLKLRTPPRRVALAASGGLSYLPRLRFAATQRVGLGVTGLAETQVLVATLPLRAEARPEGPDEGRFGVNAGAGVQVSLASRLSLTVEGRYFHFRKQTLEWSRGEARPLSPLEEALLQEVEKRLEPVEFHPTFFQATAGLAVTF